MLDELDIRNFAIIDHLRVRFGQGLTVLTGETGAGKSIIVDALGVLLGGRAGADLIRDGASQARVEGVYLLPEDPALAQTLAEHGIESDDGTVILARELTRSGRGSVRINGRAVPLSLLQSLGGRLVDIQGQTEHLALLRAADQLEILDRYAGLADERARMAALVRRLRVVRAALAQLATDEREAARRLDLLRYQVEEIDRAALTAGDDDALEAQIRVLAGAEKLREIAAQLSAILGGGDGEAASAEDALGAAARLAADLARVDSAQAELESRVATLLGEVQDLARETRQYADGIEEDPERLAAAQERQELIRTLKRKYGASIAEVLAYRDQAAAEASAIEHSDERRAELQAEDVEVAADAAQAAGELSGRRQEAAIALADHVQRELAGLNMRGARFQVRLYRDPDAQGLAVEQGSRGAGEHGSGGAEEQRSRGEPDAANVGGSISRLPQRPVSTLPISSSASPSRSQLSSAPLPPGSPAPMPMRYAFDLTGVDRVEFLVAPNVGEPPKPVAKIASGGETSRIMLALKSALSAADETATLIFDEVDVGVGGRSGQVIGEKLWGLAAHHQVICITHLPQVAVFGDSHLKISKLVSEGRTATTVEELDESERVDEVAQMVGGLVVTATTKQAACDLLDRARSWKERERARG